MRPKSIATTSERWWTRITQPDFVDHGNIQEAGCLVWVGARRLDNGRPFFAKNADGRHIDAGNWGYQYYIKEIPRESKLIWTCGTELCVNPYHAAPVPIARFKPRAGQQVADRNHKQQGRVTTHRDTSCIHVWSIEPPDGPVSLGTCQTCGKVREFSNMLLVRERNAWR